MIELWFDGSCCLCGKFRILFMGWVVFNSIVVSDEVLSTDVVDKKLY